MDFATTITGKIDRIIHCTPSSSFYILSVVGEDKQRHTIKGTAIESLSVGDIISGTGEMVDNKFGPQLQAEVITKSNDMSVDGVCKWLKDQKIPALGVARIQLLKTTFGDRLSQVVGNAAEMQKAGISASIAHKIALQWEDDARSNRLRAFLLGRGVAAHNVPKIVDHYQDKIYNILATNPWRLAYDIRGIGFKSADEIAKRNRVPLDHPFRIVAGLEYILDEHAAKAGHTAYPKGALISDTVRLLQQPRAKVSKVVDHLLARHALHSVPGLGGDIIMSRKQYAQTKGIADNVNRISRPLPLDGKYNVDAIYKKAFDEIAPRFSADFAFAEKQIAAAYNVFEHGFSIITGGPGTGKTLVINLICEMARFAGLSVKMAAFTASAAKRISEVSGYEALTIHRLLGATGGEVGFIHGPENPLPYDLIIIDEASMLDASLCYSLLRAIGPNTRILFVGDVHQLPAVGPGEILYDLIMSGRVPFVELNVTHRQAQDSGIVKSTALIKEGAWPEVSEDYKIALSEDKEMAKKMLLHLATKTFPQRGYRREDIQILLPMWQGPLGIHEFNRQMKAIYNPVKPGDPVVIGVNGEQFTVGDPVMQNDNQEERKGVVNNSRGVIADIRPKLNASGKVVDADIFVDFQLPSGDVHYTMREIWQLNMAYVGTIHKSQGNEYPVCLYLIHSDADIMLNRRLFLTANSRGKKFTVLAGNKRGIDVALSRSGLTRVTALQQLLKQTCEPVPERQEEMGLEPA